MRPAVSSDVTSAPDSYGSQRGTRYPSRTPVRPYPESSERTSGKERRNADRRTSANAGSAPRKTLYPVPIDQTPRAAHHPNDLKLVFPSVLMDPSDSTKL